MFAWNDVQVLQCQDDVVRWAACWIVRVVSDRGYRQIEQPEETRGQHRFDLVWWKRVKVRRKAESVAGIRQFVQNERTLCFVNYRKQ